MDDLPVSQPGGDFFQASWKVMREVPAGETITYSELARRAGNPLAVRAAASACARNLIAPIVPCHRIVRAGGAPGGYYYGPDTKSWLLAHERGA
jgi:methylated-DNA-[protein]-cysteine S-methyltransferase